MRPQLRLYNGDDLDFEPIVEPKVPMKLGEVANILVEASLARRTWLSDFAEEEIEVSADLYDILSTYWRIRPGA